jgi:hypothetical protein
MREALIAGCKRPAPGRAWRRRSLAGHAGTGRFCGRFAPDQEWLRIMGSPVVSSVPNSQTWLGLLAAEPIERPAMAFGIVLADPPAPVGRGVRRDPSDAARLAPAAGHTQVGLHHPTATRTAAHGSRYPQAHDLHRDRQPHVGTPARARRARQTRPPDRSLHALADPARRRDRPGTPPHGPNLEAVSDRTGLQHPRGRLRPR